MEYFKERIWRMEEQKKHIQIVTATDYDGTEIIVLTMTFEVDRGVDII